MPQMGALCNWKPAVVLPPSSRVPGAALAHPALQRPGQRQLLTALRCASLSDPVAPVNLTWIADPPAAFRTGAEGREAGLLSAFLLASSAVGGPEREVRYTCRAANARESAAQTLAVGCGDGPEAPPAYVTSGLRLSDVAPGGSGSKT
ncbi:hypothetical protein NHX12_000185 [Muraenolepis orangiensis]|uniref:Ig-like domain-containing protein n=1 Tax=Muraenolepis orangiensis TaxID=630683 RepID=A0A9Q0D9F2_9TELE|nr:hypothetical protein NHX12_000185 [Muraenolepis orangiensis]